MSGEKTRVREVKPHLNRESLYRTLSSRGNPEIRTLFNLLNGVGLRLSVTPEQVTL